MSENVYLSADQLSQRHGISRRTLERWRSEGLGPKYVRLGPRRVIYRLSDVENWLQNRTFTSDSDETAAMRRQQLKSVS